MKKLSNKALSRIRNTIVAQVADPITELLIDALIDTGDEEQYVDVAISEGLAPEEFEGFRAYVEKDLRMWFGMRIKGGGATSSFLMGVLDQVDFNVVAQAIWDEAASRPVENEEDY